MVCFLFIERYYQHLSASRRNVSSAEGFSTSGEKFRLLTNESVYDSFYANAYDSVYDFPAKVEFECTTILKETGFAQDPENVVLLDVGCGTGKTLARFRALGVGALFGIDQSQDMIDVIKRKQEEEEEETRAKPSSKCTVACGDATRDKMQFPAGKFTHITCLGGTVYELRELRGFMSACHTWLQIGGVLALHVVSKPDFSPELSFGRSCLEGKYRSVNRAKQTVDVEGFEYKEKYVRRGPKFVKEGWFRDKQSGHVRHTEQKLLNADPEEITQGAEDVGFTFRSKISLAEVGDPFQFIYFFDR